MTDAPDSPPAPDAPVTLAPPEVTGADRNSILDEVRQWFSRFVCTMDDSDLDLLSLWAAHTHVCVETYTSPRLVLDSPVPGSGKTTVLEHLERLCLNPVQMASLSSPALLVRMLDAGMRTILIDEADRTLDPKKDGVGELIAVLNSGYKRGGTRPVLVPEKGGTWTTAEMSTFSPVAMAGNNPNIPEDTRSRTIRVLLMPDIDGTAAESDWELIEDEARDLGNGLATWADGIRDQVRTERPPLPVGVIGRARERWSPLKRVAAVAGGRWPAVVDALAIRDVERVELEREEGIMQQRPAVVLLQHIRNAWPDGETFVSTATLIRNLVSGSPETWGQSSPFGKELTSQRLGKMLVSAYNVHSTRLDRTGPRGYALGSFEQAWRRMGMTRAGSPDPPKVTGASGASGDTGAHEVVGNRTPEPNGSPAGVQKRTPGTSVPPDATQVWSETTPAGVSFATPEPPEPEPDSEDCPECGQPAEAALISTPFGWVCKPCALRLVAS